MTQSMTYPVLAVPGASGGSNPCTSLIMLSMGHLGGSDRFLRSQMDARAGVQHGFLRCHGALDLGEFGALVVVRYPFEKMGGRHGVQRFRVAPGVKPLRRAREKEPEEKGATEANGRSLIRRHGALSGMQFTHAGFDALLIVETARADLRGSRAGKAHAFALHAC